MMRQHPTIKRRPTLATLRLHGCARCQTSVPEIDELLLELVKKMDLICTLQENRHDFPELVDITLVEGAVSSEEDLLTIKKVRPHTHLLVSLGGCSDIPGIPGKGSHSGALTVIHRAFNLGVDDLRADRPFASPRLLDRVRPVHEVVPVDVFVPGCPPTPGAICKVLLELISPATTPKKENSNE